MEHGPAIPVASEPDAFLQAQSQERVGAVGVTWPAVWLRPQIAGW